MTNQARMYDHPFASRPRPAKRIVRIDTPRQADRSTLTIRGILADQAMRPPHALMTNTRRASMLVAFYFFDEGKARAYHPPVPRGAPSPWVFPEPRLGNKEIERALTELGRLKDGWAGPESLAPREAVLRDLDKLLTILPANSASPEFEVDAGDGTLSLVWSRGERALSLVVNGNGNVVGVISPASENYRGWSLPIASESQIARRLESEYLREFFSA